MQGPGRVREKEEGAKEERPRSGPPAMADNEKLDNQRLKNFKNKGRDLEVAPFGLPGTRRSAQREGPGRSGIRADKAAAAAVCGVSANLWRRGLAGRPASQPASQPRGEA